jgi:hypothetical protein
MHFLFVVYCELTASECLQHYFLIIRRHSIYNNLYVACVLCRLAANGVGVGTPIQVAAIYYHLLMLALSEACCNHKTLRKLIFHLFNFFIVVLTDFLKKFSA